MIETTVKAYLDEELDVDVLFEVPEEGAPETFVKIEKTGGSMSDQIWTATFAIQSYGASMFDAAVLADTVNTAMLGIISLDNVSRCAINSGPYVFTDLELHRYRYQAVYDLVYMED